MVIYCQVLGRYLYREQNMLAVGARLRSDD